MIIEKVKEDHGDEVDRTDRFGIFAPIPERYGTAETEEKTI